MPHFPNIVLFVQFRYKVKQLWKCQQIKCPKNFLTKQANYTIIFPFIMPWFISYNAYQRYKTTLHSYKNAVTYKCFSQENIFQQILHAHILIFCKRYETFLPDCQVMLLGTICPWTLICTKGGIFFLKFFLPY